MSEFGDYLEDQFREFGAVRVRRLFGGHGVFYDGVMIGLIASEQLYLKTDAETVGRFEELGLPQFGYPKGDKRVGMSYYLAPEDALDDPTEMREWAELAYQAALRSKK
jgi:DNA transformation protein